MAPKDLKRKAEEKAEDEPAAKEAKDSGDVEKNAPEDKRPATKAVVGFNGADVTLNVVPANDGKVLMALTEGGMQYLIAGARASLGMKAGRYMYEVKIIEALNPSESTQGLHGKTPQPRQLVRIGFSTAGSNLVLGDIEEAAYFDSEGNFGSGKIKKRTSQNFTRDQVIGVLLNLDPKSPQHNTISLFREGVRIAEPQPLPESVHGKTLFPHICFRNVTVQVNMGPTLFKPLPFKCRMLAGAAAADVVETKKPTGKFDVVLPVAMPDEGTFDWLDEWLAENPSYVELSDRKLQAWAASSGLVKPKGMAGASNDKPSFNFGLSGMDDMSLQRVVKAVAPTIPRNYVVMEIKSALVAEERAELLKNFTADKFKKTAMVVMGKPTDSFIEKTHERLLAEKQAKSNADWQIKKAEKQRQKEVARRQKELEKIKKQAEENRKKLLEEAVAKKKAEEEAKKKAEAAAAGEEVKEEETKMEVDEVKEEPKAEEVKEEKMEEVKEEEKAEEVEEDDGLGDEPPKVELTDEEKKLLFRPKAVGTCGDLTAPVLTKSFASFTIPDKSEGFDGGVKYLWESEAPAKDYLRKWVLMTKQNTRIEDLTPSKYFTDKQAAMMKQVIEWQAKQKMFKAKPAAKKEEEKKEGEEEAKKALDIFSVEDVGDIGEGEPLFANFGPEDWALMTMRYELNLLQDAFKKDVDDPDRAEIPEAHINFYYNKYFKKTLNPFVFGLKSLGEMVELVKDTVTISGEPPVLSSQLAEEVDTADIFIKYTEECRRDRKRRSDAGDETAKLKFTAPAAPAPAAVRPQMPAKGQQWGAMGKGMQPGFQGMAGKGAAAMGGMMGGWGKGKW